MLALRELWTGFWAEVSEFQAVYSECRLRDPGVPPELRSTMNFAPLTCVFPELGGSSMVQRIHSPHEVVLRAAPKHDAQAQEMEGCFSVERDLRSCTVLTLARERSPREGLAACAELSAKYAGLSLGKDGGIQVHCCRRYPAAPLPVAQCQRECSSLKCGGRGTASLYLAAAEGGSRRGRPAQRPTQAPWACPKGPPPPYAASSTATGRCFPCPVRQGPGHNSALRCSTRGEDVKSSRTVLRITSDQEHRLVDAMEAKAAAHAAQAGLAELGAAWWACDEASVQDDKHRRTFVGGLMCWRREDRQGSARRGCVRWIAPFRASGASSKAELGGWVECAAAGQICEVARGSMVRLQLQSSAADPPVSRGATKEGAAALGATF
ncbi:unnamed protein product [Prorocentrum cordatum]|uniref:Uncharacterized protein n=1 Tax=Prorocentrum cordatum TaxID=2364126 RepID=A0ABN9PI51_9DINO|nr:unnamed protein product [Polarella glacialis]